MTFANGHSLVIGVGTYQHIPSANVPITAADAQKVRDVLCNDDLCGYPPDQVQFLHDETATRESILNALDKLAGDAGEDSTVLVFYAGHGEYGVDGNYYLTAHDTQVSGTKVAKGSGVSEADLLDRLRAIKAKRLLLLVNACHSGEISPNLGINAAKSFGDVSLPTNAAGAILSAGEGRAVITASRPNQKSWIGNGDLTLFTQALVDGLSGEGYVSNNGGYVSLFDLYEYVYLTVKETAEKQVGQAQEAELTILRGIGTFPVALYRGATELGTFDYTEPVPGGPAVKQVDKVQSERVFQQLIRSVDASGERSVAIGGDAHDNTFITGDRNTHQEAHGHHIAQASGGGSATVNDRSYSTVFGQRYQQVEYQYNAAGDINFGSVQSRQEAAAELRKLQAELAQALQAGVLDEDTATDAEYQLKKAVQQAEKPAPDKKGILDHLADVKGIISNATANVAEVSKLAVAVGQAIQMVQKLF